MASGGCGKKDSNLNKKTIAFLSSSLFTEMSDLVLLLIIELHVHHYLVSTKLIRGEFPQ